MNPQTGEIWKWAERDPVLLLDRLVDDCWERERCDVLEFNVLCLTSGKTFSMVFARELMDRWRQIA